MEAKELKQRTIEELKSILKQKEEKLSQFSFDLASGKVKNIREIKEAKKDIARILTIINSKSDIITLN